MMLSRKIVVALVAGAFVAAVMVVQRWDTVRPSPVESAAPARPSPSALDSSPASKEHTGSSGGAATIAPMPREPSWPIDANIRAHIDKAVATGDKLEWMPAVTELLNPIYDLDQAITVLIGLLSHRDWDIRAYVADLLLQMGSYQGVPVLQAALRAAAENNEISELAVASAATRLHRYRQSVDPGTLMRAYERFKTPELLSVLVMQQVPELTDMARSRWAQKLEGFESLRLAAFAGLKDEDAVAHYRQGLTGSSQTQLIAHWALYQATGNEQHLNQLMTWARETSGLAPKTETSWRLMSAEVLNMLSITFTPQATQALRALSDESASQAGNQETFNRAFTALFYLHRDYAFVDQRLMEFFEKKFKGEGIDRGLMMRIAAARGTAELTAAARQFNPGSYEREFIQQRHHPIEQWVDLINVPVSVAPPL